KEVPRRSRITGTNRQMNFIQPVPDVVGHDFFGTDFVTIRWRANVQYRGFSSKPIDRSFRFAATARVVPEPAYGSSTVPRRGHPTARHLSTSASGNGAACL